jgi:hypothetical protein
MDPHTTEHCVVEGLHTVFCISGILNKTYENSRICFKNAGIDTANLTGTGELPFFLQFFNLWDGLLFTVVDPYNFNADPVF